MNLQLSDGTIMQIPDDATPEAIRNFAARGEAHIKANPAPAAAAEPEDPAYSKLSTIGRMATNALTGVPDLAIAGYNAFLAGDQPGDRVRPWGERLRAWGDIPELPEDASTLRRLGEAAGAALPYGAAGIVKEAVKGGVKAGAKELLKNTLAPTATSYAGAQVGGAIGGEKGAFIGGALGGVPAGGYKALGENWVQGRYVGKGKPNAPDIAAAADRLGIEPTAGALGNYDIQKRENAYAAQPTLTSGPSLAAREQGRIRGDMATVGEDIGVQRGGTGASPAAIGEDIRGAAADRLQADRDYSSAGQENLQRDVGDRTPVRVIDIINEARAAWPHLSVPGRDALEHRIVTQLYPLISQRDAHGNPVIGPNTTVPYELVKQWRTELGQSFDQGRIPRNRELYDPATRAMADTATQAGVPPGEFNRVQQFTRGVEGEGGLAERLAPFDKESGSAHDYVLGDAGLRRPERLETFATETAGDPRQGSIFGSRLQQEARDTLGPSGGAQGPKKFAEFTENTDPRALSTLAGPQLPRLQDLGTLSRAIDTPTNVRGLSTSVAGVGNPLVNKVLGSEILGQVGQAIDPLLAAPFRGIAYLAGPTLRHIQNRILQSDAAKRGLLGQPMTHRMTLDDLIRTLNVIGQSQRSQQPPY